MAFGRSSRFSTISTTKAWRAGMSKALISPWKRLSARTCQMLIDAGERQPRQRRRLEHGEDLGDHQQPVAVPAVDEDAGEGGEQERGDLPGEADQAEQERRAGQPVDQPAGRDPRHPGADQRDGLAGEEEPVVAMVQGAQHEAEPAGLPAGLVDASLSHGGEYGARGVHTSLHRSVLHDLPGIPVPPQHEEGQSLGGLLVRLIGVGEASSGRRPRGRARGWAGRLPGG